MIDGRVPPHDLDAEAAVLSSVMVDPAALDKVLEFLKPEHFYSESHRQIFKACVEVRSGDGDKRPPQPVDNVTVGTHLKNQERIAQVGGMSYLTEVLNAAPYVANVAAYANTVVEKAKAREAIAIMQYGAASLYVDYGSLDDAIGEPAGKLNDILLSQTKTSYEHVLGPIKRAMQLAIDARNREGVTGVPTGYERYDRMTAGLHEGDLTIVAARPGMGKTSLVLNMAVNIAAPPPRSRSHLERNGVAIFSLEMPRDQIGARMVCCEGKVDVGKIRSGMLTPSDWGKLTGAAQHVGVMPIYIDDTPAIGLVELRAKVRRMQREYNGHELDDETGAQRPKRIAVVIVDYLQLMTGRADAGSREQEISEISRGLKALAKELHVAVIALSQLNRKNEERKDHRPQLSDLRESGAIEQDADNICFIYRDEYYNRNTDERNIAELIVAKQRNGPTGTAKVRFDSEYTRFDNLAEGEYVDDN